MKNILILSDGKSGHENVSKGVIENLKNFETLQVKTIIVKTRLSFLKFPLKYIINFKYLNKIISRKFIKFFYSYNDKNIDFKNINLIISTGGKTSFINIMFAKLYNINNVYCSSLRGLKSDLFTYIVTINKEDTYKNALKFDITPLKINFDNTNAINFLKKLSLKKNQQVWSILIGGPTAEYKFTQNELIELINKIVQKAELKDVKVLLSTSRRTPQKIENYIVKNIKKYKNIAYCVLYNKNPEKILSNFFQISNLVFITEDSGSMITESIYSKKPTITIYSNNKNPQKIFKLFMNNVTKNRYVHSCGIEDILDLDIDKLKFVNYDESKNKHNFIQLKNALS
jgi:mitochondrial fission protein ELM1